MLLWLEIDGVLCKRCGNDLLWCCKGECNADGDCDAVSDAFVECAGGDVVVVFAVDIVVVIGTDVSAAIAPWEWFVQSYLNHI